MCVTLCNILLIMLINLYTVGSRMFHWSRHKDGGVKWNDGKVRKLVSNCFNLSVPLSKAISHDCHMTHTG